MMEGDLTAVFISLLTAAGVVLKNRSQDAAIQELKAKVDKCEHERGLLVGIMSAQAKPLPAATPGVERR